MFREENRGGDMTEGVEIGSFFQTGPRVSVTLMEQSRAARPVIITDVVKALQALIVFALIVLTIDWSRQSDSQEITVLLQNCTLAT